MRNYKKSCVFNGLEPDIEVSRHVRKFEAGQLERGERNRRTKTLST